MTAMHLGKELQRIKNRHKKTNSKKKGASSRRIPAKRRQTRQKKRTRETREIAQPTVNREGAAAQSIAQEIFKISI
jgi:hypothetical protein